MTASHLPQSANQSRVQHDQQHQRSDGAEHGVADHLVDDEVRVAVSQFRRIQRDLVAVGARSLVVDNLLEEAWDVVADSGDDDDRDGSTRSRQRADLASQRHADRDVAIDGHQHDHPDCQHDHPHSDGHQHDHPDRHGLRDRRQRPDVRLEVRERHVKSAPGAATPPFSLRIEVVDRFHRLDQQAGDQVDDVDDGQRLQQPVRGAVLVTVAAQNDERERVADEADEAEQSDDADVDDDSKHEVAGARRRRL